MPPSANLCCCRHSRKKPLTEGIRRSTEVGTMVLNMSGKYDPNASTMTSNPVAPPINGSIPIMNGGGPKVKEISNTHTHIHTIHNRLVERSAPLDLNDIHGETRDHHHFDTARTSREEAVKDHLSMNDLVRQVRIEEGLEVTPRPSISESTPKTMILNSYSTYTNNNSTAIEQRIVEMNGNLHVKARRAVFNENGDISARTAHSHPTILEMDELDEILAVQSLPTISSVVSRSEHHHLPPIPETTGRTISRTVAAIPQTVFTVVTVTYAYCISFVAFLASLIWK